MIMGLRFLASKPESSLAEMRAEVSQIIQLRVPDFHGQLNVLPAIFFCSRIPEQVGGVVGGDDGGKAGDVRMAPAPETGQGGILAKKVAGRMFP